jgi:methyl-accepting chemotaxis protein
MRRLLTLRRQRSSGTAPAANDDAVAAPAGSSGATDAIDGRAVVGRLAQQASNVGREAAEVRGLIGDALAASTRQSEALKALMQQLQQVVQAQDAIGAQSGDSRAAVERARSAVQGVGDEVAGIVDTLRAVADAARQIGQIALQTRLVAFNASVEAKRAGEAGRGFAVVAEAVKDLAGKVEGSSKDIMRTLGELDGRIEGLAAEIRSDAGNNAKPGAFQSALADVESSVGRIDAAAAGSREICGGLGAQVSTLDGETQRTGRSLDAAQRRSETFLQVSEQLIEIVAGSGVQTEDTPYIEAAQRAASQIGALLDEALKSGAIGAAELFDEQYRPIAGTHPPQHTTRFVALADRLFPQVQEPMLQMSPKVVYCIAADRNGYIATHNRKYCHPQRGDLAWDTANSRYRRIFDDRTGLASARNTRPFLLQTYRRDMGGGKFIVMKEAAAPITVAGRHWGGVRLAFQF